MRSPSDSACSQAQQAELDLRHKANGRRLAQRKPPKESTLQEDVVRELRAALAPGWQFTASLAGEKFRSGQATLKARGHNPGFPDLWLISPVCLFHGLELKRRGEGLSDDQKTFFESPAARLSAWTDDLEEALRILRGWGALLPRVGR